MKAIISLAHSLRLRVVAEGVETAEQLEFLRELGCDQYQGFYCSPAVPPDDFVALLQAPARRSARSTPKPTCCARRAACRRTRREGG